ncbi:MAG: ABC transporter substrate-binding protein [Actinomycetia bacterium]|nr:ABC transporter substrate-binding protein [Actinomycetes bacterium]
MKGVPRLSTDLLFLLGIGGAALILLGIGLSTWFLLRTPQVAEDNEVVAREGTSLESRDAAAPPPGIGVSSERILFGQSAAFSGPAQELGQSMGLGIEAAFHEVNQNGGVHGRQLELVSLDDSYEPEAAIANTLHLIEEQEVFALIGAVGTPTSRSAVPVAESRGIPYIAPFTGAAFLRDPKWDNVINLRASYNQETEEMVARLTDELGLERIAVMYQDDSFGRAGYRGVIGALERRGREPSSIGLYPRNTLAVKTALLDLSQGSPEAVILIGAYQPVAQLIAWARHTGLDTVFMTISFVGSNALATELGPDGDGVFVTQVVPFPTDDSIPIVASYLRALAAYSPETVPGFVSLEGYLAGRLTIVALEGCGRTVSRVCFLENLQNSTSMDLGGFHVHYGVDDNQGSDAVFLTVIGSDGQYHAIDDLRDAGP